MSVIKLIIIYTTIGYFIQQSTSVNNLANTLQIQNIQIQKHDKKKTQLNFIKPIITIKQSCFDNTTLKNLSYNKNKQKQQKNINCSLILNHQQYQKEKNKINTINLEETKTLFQNTQLNKKLQQINNQIIHPITNLKQKKNQTHYIYNEIQNPPKTQEIIKNNLNTITKKTSSAITNIPLNETKITKLETQHANKKLEITQLTTTNKHKKFLINIELIKTKYNVLNKELKKLQNQLFNMHQIKKKLTVENIKFIAEKDKKNTLNEINKIIIKNKQLLNDLNQQMYYTNQIVTKQQKTSLNINKAKQILNNLLEQAQWLNTSPTLRKILKTQLSKLPKIPKSQQLNKDIEEWRIKRLKYEEQIHELYSEELQNKKQKNIRLTKKQNDDILHKQLNITHNLLNKLIIGCDNQILELTKLKISNEKLKKIITETQKEAQRYLFWIADVNPISLSYPLHIYQDLQQIFNYNILNQIKNTIKINITNQENLVPILTSISLLSIQKSLKKRYYTLLIQTQNKIKKINQDQFSSIMRNIFWSIIMSIPIPILWITIGYILKNTWNLPIIAAIGNGISATTPILWISIIISYFAHPKGLFIIHFKWPKLKIKQALHNHILFISIILPLIITLITFEKYNDQKFYSTLSRLCFIILCICLTLISKNLKRSGLKLYLEKSHSKKDIINQLIWNIIIYAPTIASLFSCLGYLTSAKILLAHLETSVIIWILLIIIYTTIKRWIFIQRHNITIKHPEHHKQNKQIIYKKCNTNQIVNKTTQNLRKISIQSLQLIRSMLNIIAILSIIAIWSELHPAFEFLENIILWNVNNTTQEINKLQKITLGTVLISILVLFITIKLVKKLPALLELMFLQHLNLTPGTGYAITTLTKYILMILGGLIVISLIGLEWKKLQWLVAALGVGLGFGLQEIFINFISGIIILFEKPIRIGDTVTIKNITGTITRINTRATTITDWDHKEIIVPNKEFIIKQFTNWSLTDTITRIVLKVPAPSNIEIEKINEILLQTIKNCSLVLSVPNPEIYLIDLQQGLPLFEIRLYTSNMKHRMPLKHQIHTLILNAYKTHGLKLPFPPFQIQRDQFFTKENN